MYNFYTLKLQRLSGLTEGDGIATPPLSSESAAPENRTCMSVSNTASLVAWLQLLQLSDSALPIGGQSHSFGMESLIAEGGLKVSDLSRFFAEWLEGSGHMEAVFCVLAYGVDDEAAWQRLNARASAMRPARENREASLRLGRRFLDLAAGLETDSRLRCNGEVHLSTAFGRVGAVLGLAVPEVVGAYLHQTLFAAVSACQRLLPLGQSAAMRLLWQLKAQTAAVIEAAVDLPEPETLSNLQPMLEVASMRHPQLHTRLFIS